MAPAAAPAAWERLAPLPVGNGGFVGGALGEEIVIAGGTTWQGDSKRWLDGIWAYAPGRNTWREAGRLPAPVAYPTSAQSGDYLWFAGGSSGESTHRTLWRLGLGPAPQQVATLEQGAVYAVGAIIGSKLYMVGGSDDQAAVSRIGNRCQAVDLPTGVVQRLADYPERGLSNAGTAAVGTQLFVFGGGYWDVEKKAVANHRSAHVYDVAHDQWRSLPPLPQPGRGFSAVALDGRHVFIAGGYRNDEVEFVADAYVFDVRNRRYTPTTPLPYAGMVALVKAGEWLYCLGGEDRKRHRTDAVFRIRIAALLPARP